MRPGHRPHRLTSACVGSGPRPDSSSPHAASTDAAAIPHQAAQDAAHHPALCLPYNAWRSAQHDFRGAYGQTATAHPWHGLPASRSTRQASELHPYSQSSQPTPCRDHGCTQSHAYPMESPSRRGWHAAATDSSHADHAARPSQAQEADDRARTMGIEKVPGAS